MEIENVTAFAEAIVDVLIADKFVPQEVIKNLASGTGKDGQELVKLIQTSWLRRNEDLKARQLSPRDPKLPIILTRGLDKTNPETELSNFLPEEKILINKDLFRAKLKGVNFARLNPIREQGLIENLQREAVGLSNEDTVLYFNLLKINALANERASNAGASDNRPNPEALAEVLLKAAESNYGLSPDLIAKLNTAKGPARPVLLAAIAEQIKDRRFNTPIVSLLLGTDVTKFQHKARRFIELTCQQRGESSEELLGLFAFYILFSKASSDSREAMCLSTSLANFLDDKLGRFRELYYASIVFNYTFFLLLLTQVLEINKKFQQSPDEQKEKLKKLYKSDERIGLLVGNSINLAMGKIAQYKMESRQIQTTLKKYLSLNADLLTQVDMFNQQYEQEGKS